MSEFVNGIKIDQTTFLQASIRTSGGSFLGENDEVIVPADNYFVMGDNRDFSSDSREWGFVPKDKIIGKSILVYWPLNHIRTVKHTPF